MNGNQFKDARERLGLSYGELSLILGGVRPDTIRKKWEHDNPAPSPIAVSVVEWMQEGFRPPQWPDRLAGPDHMAQAACGIALAVVEQRTGQDRWEVNSGRALDIIRATATGDPDGR